MESRNILEVVSLKKVFKVGKFLNAKEILAVNNVSFKVQKKEVLGLVGESGSGKTTIARIIAKQYDPDGGKILFNQNDVTNNLKKNELKKYRKDVQYIFQDPFSSLNDFYSIGQLVERPLIVNRMAIKKARKDTVLKTLEICGLKPAQRYIDCSPYELSGGQRQRVGIARALISKPKILLADEPTSMLDASIRIDIMNVLLNVNNEEELAMIYITHDLAGAHYVCDQIAVLYSGSIVEIGNSSEVINKPKHPYTQLLKMAAPKPELGLKPETIPTNGEMVDLSNIPEGCPFYPRCPHVKDVCKREKPILKKVENDILVSCWMYK